MAGKDGKDGEVAELRVPTSSNKVHTLAQKKIKLNCREHDNHI